MENKYISIDGQHLAQPETKKEFIDRVSLELVCELSESIGYDGESDDFRKHDELQALIISVLDKVGIPDVTWSTIDGGE